MFPLYTPSVYIEQLFRRPATGIFIDTVHVTFREGWELDGGEVLKVSRAGSPSLILLEGAHVIVKSNQMTMQLGGELLASRKTWQQLINERIGAFRKNGPGGAASYRDDRRGIEAAGSPRITRIDLAVDYYCDGDMEIESVLRCIDVPDTTTISAISRDTAPSRAAPRWVKGDPYSPSRTLYLGKRKTGRFQLRLYAKTSMEHGAAMRRWGRYPEPEESVVRLEVEMGRKILKGKESWTTQDLIELAADRVELMGVEWARQPAKPMPDAPVALDGMLVHAKQEISRIIGRMRVLDPETASSLEGAVEYDFATAKRAQMRTRQRLSRIRV